MKTHTRETTAGIIPTPLGPRTKQPGELPADLMGDLTCEKTVRLSKTKPGINFLAAARKHFRYDEDLRPPSVPGLNNTWTLRAASA